MIRDVLDTHTHTLASGHAYSTIRENAKAAEEKGLELLAITEHAPLLVGSCIPMYFKNLRVVDRHAYGVELMMGVELNILDEKGRVDLAPEVIKGLDIAIASLHLVCIKPRSKEYHTEAYINAMRNPYIDIIGHPDDSRYPVDYLALVQAAKEYGTLLELNDSSMRPGSSRQNTKELNTEMLKLCMKYEVPIVMGSDAHVDTDVGRHDTAIKLLEEIGFPEHLVVNRSVAELKKRIKKYL